MLYGRPVLQQFSSCPIRRLHQSEWQFPHLESSFPLDHITWLDTKTSLSQTGPTGTGGKALDGHTDHEVHEPALRLAVGRQLTKVSPCLVCFSCRVTATQRVFFALGQLWLSAITRRVWHVYDHREAARRSGRRTIFDSHNVFLTHGSQLAAGHDLRPRQPTTAILLHSMRRR